MSAPAIHEFILEADSDVRLDLLVARRLDLSRTQAATLIANGLVSVGGRRQRASYRPRAGELVRVEIPPRPGRTVPGSSTGSTRTRRGCSSSPRRTGRTGC